jgi:hypothetical protein
VIIGVTGIGIVSFSSFAVVARKCASLAPQVCMHCWTVMQSQAVWLTAPGALEEVWCWGPSTQVLLCLHCCSG